MELRSLFLAVVALTACHAPAGEPRSEPQRAVAPPGTTLVLILTGPKSGQLAQDENARVFAGHFANMQRMAEEGQLLVAGPFGEQRHDPDLRGLFVLATAERDEARRWAETDPTTQAGVFTLAYHDLVTSAPLAEALARDLAWRAEQVARGEEPEPGEGARGYVLLTAEHGDLAERELAALATAEGGVFLLGRLDGTRALALLDAATVAEARERFGPQLDALGTHVLDEWFASAELARMVD